MKRTKINKELVICVYLIYWTTSLSGLCVNSTTILAREARTCLNRQKTLFLGHGGDGQMVSVLAFYSDDPSSNLLSLQFILVV